MNAQDIRHAKHQLAIYQNHFEQHYGLYRLSKVNGHPDFKELELACWYRGQAQALSDFFHLELQPLQLVA